jgi:glycosyltransferase involved in cell wall biosynthesis
LSIIKLAHIITGLNTGGAEMMLSKLIEGMKREVFSQEIISLTDIGPVGEKLAKMGYPVFALGMSRNVPDPGAFIRLVSYLKKNRPHLIQTWMYHADLVGGLAAKFSGKIPVIWNIRHSNLNPEGNKRTTIWTAKMCAHFSHWIPVKIVCCSEASKHIHTELGYDSEKMIVIPNGFDLTAFSPDPEARISVRKELGIPENSLIIGLVARFDPLKDHGNFLRAAGILIENLTLSTQEIHFILCGNGVIWENEFFVKKINGYGLKHWVHLLGRREDIPRLTAAFDIASSSSSGEGFPNVIGEAMACGVPCVVTNVGDSALIVGDAGIVVPPKNPEALAEAWLNLIKAGKKERKRLGERARRRVLENYNLPDIVERYETLYREVLGSGKENFSQSLKITVQN